MHKVYVRELKPYSLSELAELLCMDTLRTHRFVMELMMCGIIRFRNSSAMQEPENDGEEAAPDELFQFVFVGMAMLHDTVIVSYPKYFRDRVPTDEELKQIIRVLKRDVIKTSISSLMEGGTFVDDKLPVMLALLELYSEYGAYSNFIENRDVNGRGDIDWGRTINRHLPLLVDGGPIYVEYETRRTQRDESDFLTRLHRSVLTQCSLVLEQAGISSLLSIDEVYLSDEEVEDLGDVESLEWRLNRERSAQFIDWKIATLDLLEHYLLNRDSAAEHNQIYALGVTNFYHLWEDACKVAFGDSLDEKIGSLGLALSEKWSNRSNETLLGIIPRPKWERYADKGYIDCGEVATLFPDTIAFAVTDGEERVFCIYDAKYYVPSQSGKIKAQPGLESVTKQFLYQSAYRDFISVHNYSRVVNAFLVPTASDDLRKMARVSFPEVMGKENLPFSNYVDMWALPAYEIFDAYLQNERIDCGVMKTIWMSED